jgi:hypothetical protein
MVRQSSWCPLLGFALLLAGCARTDKPPFQDLTGHEDLSRFNIQSVTGVRDGDKLNARALVSDSSSILTVDLHFAIGSPTTLQSGTWNWSRPNTLIEGTVTARSVTFLGGQDGPPSIGGTFDLDAPSYPTYRLTLPLTVLPRPVRPRASDLEHP